MALRGLLVVAASLAALPHAHGAFSARGWARPLPPEDEALKGTRCNIERRPGLSAAEFEAYYRDKRPVILGDTTKINHIGLSTIETFMRRFGELPTLLHHPFRRGDVGQHMTSIIDFMTSMRTYTDRIETVRQLKQGAADLPADLKRMVWDDDSVSLFSQMTDNDLITVHPGVYLWLLEQIYTINGTLIESEARLVHDKSPVRDQQGGAMGVGGGGAAVPPTIEGMHRRIVPESLCRIHSAKEDECACDADLVITGESGRGLAAHFHGSVPGNLQLYGRKRWWFWREPLPGGQNHRRSTLEWLKTVYPLLPDWWFEERGDVDGDGEDDGPLMFDCTVNPGELMYVPNGFYHGTMAVGHEINVAFRCMSQVEDKYGQGSRGPDVQRETSTPPTWKPPARAVPAWRLKTIPAFVNASRAARAAAEAEAAAQRELQEELAAAAATAPRAIGDGSETPSADAPASSGSAKPGKGATDAAADDDDDYSIGDDWEADEEAGASSSSSSSKGASGGRGSRSTASSVKPRHNRDGRFNKYIDPAFDVRRQQREPGQLSPGKLVEMSYPRLHEGTPWPMYPHPYEPTMLRKAQCRSYTGRERNMWSTRVVDLLDNGVYGWDVAKLQHMANIFNNDPELLYSLGAVYLRYAASNVDPVGDTKIQVQRRAVMESTGVSMGGMASKESLLQNAGLVNTRHVALPRDEEAAKYPANIRWARAATIVLERAGNWNPVLPETYALLAYAYDIVGSYLVTSTKKGQVRRGWDFMDRALAAARHSLEVEPHSNAVCNQIAVLIGKGALEGAYGIGDDGVHERLISEAEQAEYHRYARHCDDGDGACLSRMYSQLVHCADVGRRLLRTVDNLDAILAVAAELRTTTILLRDVLEYPSFASSIVSEQLKRAAMTRRKIMAAGGYARLANAEATKRRAAEEAEAAEFALFLNGTAADGTDDGAAAAYAHLTTRSGLAAAQAIYGSIVHLGEAMRNMQVQVLPPDVRSPGDYYTAVSKAYRAAVAAGAVEGGDPPALGA